MSSLQNKIWDLPNRSTILLKFTYDKEGKLDGLTQILPVSVCSLALILKTGWVPLQYIIILNYEEKKNQLIKLHSIDIMQAILKL